MYVLFLGNEANDDAWKREIRAAAPGIDLREPDAVDDPAKVRYAIVGRTRPGELRGYPNLAAILSMWAGVEHLLDDCTIPRDIPIVRMVEPSLTHGMVEYVCCHALNILLRTDRYTAAGWRHPQKTDPRFAADLTVGIMGMGVLGSACAEALARLGFNVIGWSRTEKSRDGIASHAGRRGLERFLGSSDILVLLLPNTPQTRGILDAAALRLLPPGSSIINAGRGELVDDDALLAALESGSLERAVLDVFRIEPLPDDHPFRRHPGIVVTPHVASVTNPKTAAPVLAANLGRLEDGETVWPLVDRDRGY